MSDLRLEIVDAPDQDDVAVLTNGLAEFNQGFVPSRKPEPLGVFLRDERGAIVGGIEAFCRWRTGYINRVWVAPSFRGAGAGRRLMNAFESEVVARGIAMIWVETMDWQAQGFYQKHGYREFARLAHPEPAPGVGARCSIFLRKDIG